MSRKPLKVCIIGSGNWGTAISKIIGENVTENPDRFESRVQMWVYEENINGQKLSEIINTQHENVKYMPGVKLPECIIANPNLFDTVRGSNLLVFVIPHQYIIKTCEQLREMADRDPTFLPKGARAISLTKGLLTSEQGKKINLKTISFTIKEILKDSISNCSCLSGANLAGEISNGQISEATIGSEFIKDGETWKLLFQRDYFIINTVRDTCGVEVSGALKNIVAVGAGLSDGLKWAENTKSMLIRLGLLEIRRFGKQFFPRVRDDTFLESCGIADIITSGYGGRNRKVSAAFVETRKSFEELEKEMLNGQKLQGPETASEVHAFLVAKRATDQYPLFESIYKIVFEGMAPEDLLKSSIEAISKCNKPKSKL
eukprot:TRINITY_DN13347_c0_g1_i1.p1 TRINITY_DN13347_c0_g1~~TRINITY_DN13347_c0_g1_i1.p1  ORF type:complete len:373 (+),score=97.92 TRINITY_DN13347_c0_g1_i1:31-1149(+)